MFQIANTRNLDGAASWPGVDDNAKLVLSSDEIESRVKSLESTNTALSRRQSGNPNRDGIVGIGHEIGAFVGPPIGTSTTFSARELRLSRNLMGEHG